MVRIGNYEYKHDRAHFLGEGTFSTVYLGKYIGANNQFISNNTEVAIKVMSTENIKPSAMEIIEDELFIMALIKNNPHPNIVECYDIIRGDNRIYIILEYCNSGNLSYIIRKPIKETYTQFYFSQLANGLKYLDKNNIVHRDIKPKNILLTDNHRILKIADFGFAKQNHDNQLLHETICGSPLYMAPEIMHNKSYNNQTDLWSIGMILYEMLFGYHPYHDCKKYNELRDKINDDEMEIPPKNNTNKETSKECLDLLESLLQKDVTKRISWDEFFNNPWINKYQYINTNKESYKAKMCKMSLGSLPKLNEYLLSKSPEEIVIIDNFLTKSTNGMTRSSKYDTIPPNDNFNIASSVECSGIFEIEFENSDNTLPSNKVIVKKIIDKSSVLENIDDNSHRYELIQ